MTIIQSTHHSDILNRVLAGLAVAALIAAALLVFFYNRLVTLSHGIKDTTAHIASLQTKNAEIKDAMLALFSTTSLEAIAAEKTLVKEKNPQYLTIKATWPLASR